MTLPLAPESVITEGADWTAAVNRNQNVLGKSMLVLRRPCTAVVDIDRHEWAALHGEIERMVSAIDALFAPDQFNFAFLMNVDSQVHLHVIPRYSTSRIWNGRAFVDSRWGRPVGDEIVPIGAGELELLASQIRRELAAPTAM